MSTSENELNQGLTNTISLFGLQEPCAILERLSQLRQTPKPNCIELMVIVNSMLNAQEYSLINQVMHDFPMYKQVLLDSLTEHLVNLAILGNQEAIAEHIDRLGLDFAGDNSAQMNMFELAITNSNLELAKFIQEVLGVSSNKESLLQYAVAKSDLAMFEYLYERGFHPTDPSRLIKIAVKQHSLVTLKHLCQHGLTLVENVRVFEWAVRGAAEKESIDVLRFLVDSFEFEFDFRHISPLGSSFGTSCSLYSSFNLAVKKGFIELFEFAAFELKLEFTTEDRYSDWSHYATLLPAAIEAEDFQMLKFLINELKIRPKMLIEVSNESLFQYACSVQVRKLKKQFIEYLLQHDADEHIEDLEVYLTSEQLADIVRRHKKLVRNSSRKKPKLTV